MVEFALVIPIFLLVLCGILDFGFMLFTRMSVINAAREGARSGIMVADVSTIPGIVQARVISAAAQAGLGLDSSNVPSVACIQTHVTPSSTTPCSYTTTPAAVAGDSLVVTVTYDYHTFFPLLFGTKIPLTSTVQMVLEGGGG